MAKKNGKHRHHHNGKAESSSTTTADHEKASTHEKASAQEKATAQEKRSAREKASAAEKTSAHQKRSAEEKASAHENKTAVKGDRPGKMKRKDYEHEMRLLHGGLVAMQEWVKNSGAKVCIVLEGRDTAGKGGTIKRIVERVSPRTFRVVALPAPTEREKSQMYVQRYLPHLPAAGEVVIFDRSWYNRAGVEKVMGFCTPEETERFLAQLPGVEKAMVDSGIILLKYWLEVSPDEQTRRLRSRINDPRKTWKLSDMDLKSYSRWYDYSRARDAMFAATDTAWAPWYVANTDDKMRGRLNIITHLLNQIPYKPLPPLEVTLPRRQPARGYAPPNLPLRYIPTPF
ncbi:MAG TPA: polyphosphate kinase 2 [Acidimicrobiales bacterium]|nr:polyphosphate kinase 2 [Acidimicrobiales bacterium]